MRRFDSVSISVVIVNWNAGQSLTECVASLLKYGGDILNEIIIVDNGSTDESLKFLTVTDKIKVHHAGENLGFGKACNFGAKLANSEYLLFLNPDAAVYSGTLEKVADFMSSSENGRVGICGVQLYDEYGHIACSCARFPQVSHFFAHVIGLDRIFPQLGHFMLEWDHCITRAVDQVIGAFFFVRRKLFVELNGFDERFFVYFEEVDFALRAKQAGWQSVYFADAQAFHSGGGSSRKVKAQRLFYSLRSRLLYAEKHFSRFDEALLKVITWLLEPVVRAIRLLATRRWEELHDLYRAYALLRNG